MSQTHSVEIRCENCDVWFPTPIFVSDDPLYDVHWIIEIGVDCPACGLVTECTLENIRVRPKHDGFLEVENDR